MRKRSQADLVIEDILAIMSQDSESSKVIGDSSEAQAPGNLQSKRKEKLENALG